MSLPDWFYRDLVYRPKQMVAGEDVKHVQRLLGMLDHGVYDERTETKVRGWQQLNGLHPDGVVERLTARAMG